MLKFKIVESNLFEKVNFRNDEMKYQNQKIVTWVRGIGSVAHKK